MMIRVEFSHILTQIMPLNVNSYNLEHANTNELFRKVTVVIYLEMYINKKLKWDEYINFIIPQISAKIVILRSLRSLVFLDTLKLLYNDIVQPHFDYADTVHDPAPSDPKESRPEQPNV